LNQPKTINCKGKLVDLDLPKVMGILNMTPDSFYDGGKTVSEKEILSKAEGMLIDGATFIDIGGYSSRPGASHLSEEEELLRVIPAVQAITREFPDSLISIDTFRSSVVKKAIENGAALVNDISAGTMDNDMYSTISDLQIPYIMMHMRGNPQTMMDDVEYDNISKDIIKYFSIKLAEARQAGINDLIVDPGFGFSKTRKHNFELLNHLELFKFLDVPILVGISRKSMIYKTLDSDTENALNGTTALHVIALDKGASLLRVHDVKEAVECITLMENLKNGHS
jgi:dihydropteroate synthase